VYLDNTNFRTTTNVDGSWSIENVPEGQYDVTATKAGFGTFHWYEQNVVGGRNDLSTAAIARMPNAKPDPTVPTFAGVTLSFGLSWGSNPRHQAIAAFIDFDSTVEPSAPHFATAIGTPQYISLDDLRAAGVRPGQIFFVSYAWAFDTFADVDYGHYEYMFFDPRHQQMRYSSTGPKSRVFTVTMPQ
jgi:hypothetical protein